MNIPRSEHPRPDKRRENWLCLNGEWDFEIDNSVSGIHKGFQKMTSFSRKITVPFCPESKLSGIENLDFMYAVWYTRTVTVPENWKGSRIILHIGGSDYKTTVFVNGRSAGTHSGGYTSFSFDITKLLCEGENRITVYAVDDILSGKQPSGKQTRRFEHYGCYYTRNTGIWQSVWLEAVGNAYVKGYKTFPSVSTCSVSIESSVNEAAIGGTLKITALYDGKEVGSAETEINSLSPTVNIPLSEKHLWEAGNGRLYTLKFALTKDDSVDLMEGYFGLREVALTKEGFMLNGKKIFLRFVLDQGYYPDGIITAPTDEDLIKDITVSMDCGFNGARLHQKVFEPRYLYHADRLGYLVCGETGNWGAKHTDPESVYPLLTEWMQAVERDFSHPAIVMWCPFNETWDINNNCRDVRVVDTVYLVTKQMDRTRPVIADSGSWPTTYSDAHDVHDYEQDPELLASYYCETDKGIVKDQLYRRDKGRQRYNGKPIFVSEYGGIKWVDGQQGEGWGYGKDVTSEDEFFARLEGLTDVLLNNKSIFGFCYTQLFDVELEHNGFMTYDRRLKFPAERFKAIIGKPSKENA